MTHRSYLEWVYSVSDDESKLDGIGDESSVMRVFHDSMFIDEGGGGWRGGRPSRQLERLGKIHGVNKERGARFRVLCRSKIERHLWICSFASQSCDADWRNEFWRNEFWRNGRSFRSVTRFAIVVNGVFANVVVVFTSVGQSETVFFFHGVSQSVSVRWTSADWCTQGWLCAVLCTHYATTVDVQCTRTTPLQWVNLSKDKEWRMKMITRKTAISTSIALNG